MKNLIFLTITILAMFSLGACRKETPKLPPTIVKGKVTEYGTDKPLEGVKAILMEGTYNVSLGNSYYPVDSTFTDKEGNYAYDNIKTETGKSYYIWYSKSRYFDISNIENNEQITDVEENNTTKANIKLFPYAWLKIRVINDKPFGDGDYFRIRGDWSSGGLDDTYYGKDVNLLITKKIRGGKYSPIKWWVEKKGILVFKSDSIYATPHDTTYYELKY